MSDIIDGAYEYKKMLLRSDEVDTKCATRKVLAQGIIENTIKPTTAETRTTFVIVSALS